MAQSPLPPRTSFRQASLQSAAAILSGRLFRRVLAGSLAVHLLFLSGSAWLGQGGGDGTQPAFMVRMVVMPPPDKTPATKQPKPEPAKKNAAPTPDFVESTALTGPELPMIDPGQDLMDPDMFSPPTPSEEAEEAQLEQSPAGAGKGPFTSGQVALAMVRYQTETEARLRATHNYPANFACGLEVEVKVTVDREGNLVDRELLNGSGNRLYDFAVLLGLRRTRFPAIPEEVTAETITQRMVFTSGVNCDHKPDLPQPSPNRPARPDIRGQARMGENLHVEEANTPAPQVIESAPSETNHSLLQGGPGLPGMNNP